MFDIISGINIGQGAGNAFGGGIYGASCDIGFSNGPTRITLNVVSESGIYQSLIPNVYSSPYNINMNGKVFSGMYMYGFEKTKSAGQALLTVNFVDASLVLDKIFVGLLNRHGNLHKQTQLQTGYFTVRCPSCTQGIVSNVSGWAQRYVDAIPGGFYFSRNEDGGGYIIVGKESFPESNCEIPKVDYNFSELCSAISAFGIKHELAIFDVNPMYRQEYAGTLREVLNNWASDFNFEFFFDEATLKAIDLRRPVNLSAIKTLAETHASVTSMSYSETLENTFAQSIVARYIQPSFAREYNNTFNIKQIANAITLPTILKSQTCAGRMGSSLFISIALARLDNALREAFIANMAVVTNNYSYLEALGFRNYVGDNLPYMLDAATKAVVIKNLSTYRNQSSTSVETCDPNNYAVFLGLYRSDVKDAVEAWDKSAADFIGRYFTFVAPVPADTFGCPYASDWFIYYTYSSKWATLPSSSTYGGNALPFANLMRDPTSQTNLASILPNTNLFECPDNSWGTEQSTYDTIKGTNDYDAIKPRVIPFDDLPIPSQMALKTLQQQASTNLPSAVLTTLQKDALAQGAQVAFLVVPLLNSIPNAPFISDIVGRTVNPLVFQRVSSRNNNDEASSRCSTYCDSNIVSELCNCGAQYTPSPYFSNLFAPFFQVVHPGGATCNIIFPVDSPYWGYFTHQRFFKTTYPPTKAIFGTPPTAANNTMATRIVDYDITPDIDAIADSNDAINLYIFSPTDGQIYTAQEYYDSLANLNNLTVPVQQKVSMTVAKSNVSTLGISISPVNGLISMNISLSDGGIQTEMEFATRPPSIPKPEAIFTKIKYRLRS